ncbi:MAG: hypothetical protein AAGE98_09245 [Actinomycetota bacterium]
MHRTPIVDADERRITLALAHRAAVIVEAPAGFGKSRLLHGVAAAVDSAAVITSHDDLRHHADHADRVAPTIVIDVADPDPHAVALLADRPHVEMLVVAGRVVGRAIRDVLGRYDCLEITTDDLALTDAEIATLLHVDDPALVSLVRAQTDGWPAAVTALAAQAERGPLFDDPAVLRRGLVHHPVIDRLLRETVAGLPGELVHALVRFGLLEHFTAAAFDAVTEPGAIRAIVEHGVPVLETADGWLHLPSVLRTHLGDDIDPVDAERIAPHLAQSGGLIPAARTLVSSGSLLAAAHLVLDAPRTTIDDAEPHALLGVLDALEPVASGAALPLIRARVHENRGQVREAQEIVDGAVAGIDPHADGWVTARLEQLRFAAMNDAVGPDDELLLDLTSPEHQTRLREVMGLRAAQSSDPERVEESIALLETAAGEWLALGDPTRAASALRIMAAVALMHLGRYPEAIDAVGRARRLATHRLYDRAVATVLTLRLASLAGRPDIIERELPAAQSLTSGLEMPWLEHHIAASMAHACVLTDRADDAVEWARRAESLLGGMRNHSTGTLFHADMATAMTLAGRHDEADHHLEIARSRRDDNPTEVAVAEATIAARRNDVALAGRLLDEIRSDPTVPDSRLWRPRLELAVAVGDATEIDAAKATAELVGLRDFANRLAAPADDVIAIQVLGGLAIRRGGTVIDNPTGKPAELLKLLVCRGGSVTTDQAIDALWDDGPDTEVGLRRLKNPINRLREAVGADAVLRSSVGIHLGPGVDTDLARFSSAASRATGYGGGREASLAAVDALNLYEPLLPDEPPSELIANRSVDLVVTASGLFDQVLRQAPPDRPSSSWLLDTARRIDLYAEPWFAAIARIAIEEHNIVHARQAIALARAAAAELDLPANPEIENLTEQLLPEQGHVAR